jgi:hypothetical protein
MSGRAVFFWVLLPFVALSALALWLTRDAPVRAETGAMAEAVEVPAPPEPKAPPHAVPDAPREVAPPPEDEERVPEPPPGTWDEEEVRVALRSIQPLVRECFLDAAGRHPGPQSVKLRFTLEARGERGGFQGAEVLESTVQDPFVLACLLDTLADTQFSAPPGRAPLTLTHPFHFRPEKGGDP